MQSSAVACIQAVLPTPTPTYHNLCLVVWQGVNGQASPYQVLADSGPVGLQQTFPCLPPPAWRLSSLQGTPRCVSCGKGKG